MVVRGHLVLEAMFYKHSFFPQGKGSKKQTTACDSYRRGVWLGRHIFYRTTKVSQDELSENRNLT